MDPQACWNELVALLKEAKTKKHETHGNFLDEDCERCDNITEIVDHLRNLAEWIEKGGFLPEV